jgi:hypothetical protein
MRKAVRCFSFVLATMATTAALGQLKPRETRHPAADAEASAAATPAPTYEFFSILDGPPLLLELHHDTEVGTNKPIDVFMFVIEMQVMNSDGNFEPVGLQIHNFYTQYAQDPANASNPNHARDCRIWNYLVNTALLGPTSSSRWHREHGSSRRMRTVRYSGVMIFNAGDQPTGSRRSDFEKRSITCRYQLVMIT